MVPVSSIISFFQVGAVNNGRNWARIAIMGSEWGMNFLLDKMSFCQLLSYTKRSFMPCFSTQIVQSRAKRLCVKVASIRSERDLTGICAILLSVLIKRSQTTLHTASKSCEPGKH